VKSWLFFDHYFFPLRSCVDCCL